MDPKPITASRTVWGALAMLIAFLLQKFNVAASAEEIEIVLGQLAQALEILSGVGGFALVIWGRIKARGPVTLSGKP